MYSFFFSCLLKGLFWNNHNAKHNCSSDSSRSSALLWTMSDSIGRHYVTSKYFSGPHGTYSTTVSIYSSLHNFRTTSSNYCPPKVSKLKKFSHQTLRLSKKTKEMWFQKLFHPIVLLLQLYRCAGQRMHSLSRPRCPTQLGQIAKTHQKLDWKICEINGSYTDKTILDKSFWLVKHFPDFPLWKYGIASFSKLNC